MRAALGEAGRPAAVAASSPALPVTSIPDPAHCEVSFSPLPVIFQWTLASYATGSSMSSVLCIPFAAPADFCVTKMDFVPRHHRA